MVRGGTSEAVGRKTGQGGVFDLLLLNPTTLGVRVVFISGWRGSRFSCDVGVGAFP